MTTLMAWLVPAAGPARDRLTATIDRLAAEHGAPRFPPHITLAGLFDSGETAASQALMPLAAGVQPFTVRFAAVGQDQAYFRCLYLRAEPSQQLTALREAALAALALERRPYLPHLSLLYSDMAAQRKRPIIDALDLRLPLTVPIDAAELWADDQQGVVSAWRRVTRLPFEGTL
jgi:2'-5' RNA ligase